MSDAHIVRYSAEELQAMIERGETLTDWERLRTMTEAELEAAIADDPDWNWMPTDYIPKKIEEMRRNQSLGLVRVDSDVLQWFAARPGGSEAQVNDVLRAYMRDHAGD